LSVVWTFCEAGSALRSIAGIRSVGTCAPPRDGIAVIFFDVGIG
jgi:hypothetical protein